MYDGHGEHGQEVSQFAMEYIRDNLHKHPSFSTDLPAALKTTFLACDLAMKKDPTVDVSTPALLLLWPFSWTRL